MKTLLLMVSGALLPLLRAFLLLFGACACLESATIITVDNTLPTIGDPSEFAIFSVSLTEPDPADGAPYWLLTVETNYGGLISGSTADGDTVVPNLPYGSGAGTIGDFLISWNGGHYGVVLGNHDGYQPGYLYLASGFQTETEALGFPSGRPDQDVWLVGGGSLQGTGVESGGRSDSSYFTITDEFNAPPGFLMTGSFDFSIASFACGNGLILGTGSFELPPPPPPPPQLPEPGTLVLMVPALLVFGCKLARPAGRPSLG